MSTKLQKLPKISSLIPSQQKFKGFANTAYHSSIVTLIAAITSRIQKMLIKKSQSPKLSLDLEHLVVMYIHITNAMFIENLLVSMQILPEKVVN